MRPNRSLLGVALIVAACQAPGVSTAHKPTTVASSAAEALHASAPAGSTTPPTTAPAVALLARPKGQVSELDGNVSIDASYLLSNNAGSLLSNNGSGVLAAGGGQLLGGQLVAGNGAGVVAQASGNVIAAGSGLLSDHGSGVLAQHGANYHTLQAEAQAYGRILPAAGMQVQVVGLASDQPLALGNDAAGKPVYTIYTNTSGGFQVYLPAAVTGNVRLEASVPGHSDTRLLYPLVTTPAAQGLRVDEDGAAASRYIHLVLAGRFASLLQVFQASGDASLTDDQLVDQAIVKNGLDGSALGTVLHTFLLDLITQVRLNPRVTVADYAAVGDQIGDVVLASAGDITALPLVPALAGDPQAQANFAADPDHDAASVMEAIRDVASDLRQGVTKAGVGQTPAQVAALFARKPYLVAANHYHARLHPTDPVPFYSISKPSDLADFLAVEYLSLADEVNYGCAIGDCPDPDPACDPLTGCFPSGGVRNLSVEQSRAMERALLSDVGVATTHIDLLGGAAGSVFAAGMLHCLDPDVQSEIHCVIQNYGQSRAGCGG